MPSYEYTTTPVYPAKVLLRGDPEYERCRRNNPTANTPERFPREIHIVETPEDVLVALNRAASLGVTVGVRGSGHLLSLPGLVDDGVLIDTANLNRHIDYDRQTHVISFGPSVRVEELAAKLVDLKRFFPHGHAPTVGSAGFLLAGGLGWFSRGWGATCQNWIQKMEIVTADGQVVIASPTGNRDLWWSARGSGLAFFGVVTRFWCYTIRASNMWERTFRFTINYDNYETLMNWALERGRATPKYGTDLALTIDYPEKNDPAFTTDDVPPGSQLHMILNLICYSDTEMEATTLLSAYDNIHKDVKPWLLDMQPVQKRTFEDVFMRKIAFWGNGKVDRWQMNGMLNDPAVPLPKLLEAIKPAMLDLPTRLSSVFITSCEVMPDEEDTVLSLPQDLYISTFTGWTDPASEPAIYKPMRDRYKRASQVAMGMYIADFDVGCDDANIKVMTDTALAKFLKIREKWDPKGLFPSYKKIVETHDRVNKLQNKALL